MRIEFFGCSGKTPVIRRFSMENVFDLSVGREIPHTWIQLFRERLSEKVHATILKGTLGGFEFAVLQRNLEELHERPWTYVCAC